MKLITARIFTRYRTISIVISITRKFLAFNFYLYMYVIKILIALGFVDTPTPYAEDIYVV